MSELPHISDAELEVMKIIWDQAPINTNAIVSQLASRTAWSPKTIQTMLIRLEKKGVLAHTKEGRLYVYTPLVAKSDYLAQASSCFLDRFFDGAFSQLVASFIEQDRLTEEDLCQLRAILEQKQHPKQ